MSTVRDFVGIDLGTTCSSISIWEEGQVKIILNDQGNTFTPSFVSFTQTGRLFGETAKSQVAINPQNTVFKVKRLIGRRFVDTGLQSDIKNWPFKVVDIDAKPHIKVDFKGEIKTFSPEEITSMI